MTQKLSLTRAGLGKSGAVIILVLLVITALAILFILNRQETVKIGAILSLSGAASYVGEETRDGMFLAIDEINTWGGVNGQKIELIIEDSETNSQKGKAAFQAIETAHRPILYVSTLSSVGIALAPLAEENEVVLVGLVTTAPEFASQSEWVFRYFPTAKDEVPPILSILEELKVKNLGMIYINDEYGRSFFSLTRQAFEKTGGAVRGEPFDGKTLDFKEQIATLKDTEAIYAVVHPGHLESLFTQLRETNYGGFIVGAGNTSIPTIRSLPEANGIYVVAPIIYAPNFLYAKEIREKYEARYGKPFNHYAAGGYDLMKLLAGLLEDEEISRKNVKQLLEIGFTYPGVFGELNVTPGEHDIGFPLHPAQIFDGEVQYR